MSEKTLETPWYAGLWLATFVAGKFVGGYMATWSWWWLLMPIVPVIGTLIHWMAR